jgi:hypothetical protein
MDTVAVQEELARAGRPSIVAEAAVTGRTAPRNVVRDEPVDPATCPHDGIGTEVKTLVITDDAGTPVGWEAQLEAMCWACGRKFDIAPLGRKPRDGRSGVVVVMKPAR